MASSSASTSSSPSTTQYKFVVIDKHPVGVPGQTRRLSPDDYEYKLIANAALVACDVLSSDLCRSIFAQFALDFERVNGPFRRRLYKGDDGDEQRALNHVEIFVAKIRARFPTIAIEGNLVGNTILGYHEPLEWKGEASEFDTDRMWIFINSERMEGLVKAAYTSDDYILSKEHEERYLIYLFKLATTLIHESMHVFVTFLTNGTTRTPRKFNHSKYVRKEDIGESGRFLETRLFGGALEWSPDSAQDHLQSGIPYLLDDEVDEGSDILFEAIKGLVVKEEPMIFPFSVSHLSRKWGEIPKFAYDPAEGEAIGIPRSSYDPAEGKAIGIENHTARYWKALQDVKPQTIRLDEVYKVSVNPGIKLIEVK